MAVAACAFLLRYAQFLDRLLPDGVERVGLVSYPYEIDFLQVDAADRVVVQRFVVESAVRQIDRRGPLRRARYVGSMAFGVLDSDRNVEVVQNMEALQYRVESRLACRAVAL